MSCEKKFFATLGLDAPTAPELYVPEVTINGQAADMAALRAIFGDINYENVVDFHPAATHYFRLRKLEFARTANIQFVHVRDKNGAPVANIPVVRSWAYPNYTDAPPLQDWTSEFPQTPQYTKTGVVGKTNVNGVVEFAMGTGDKFFVDRTGGGFSCVYPAHHSGPGDPVYRLGMLDGTGYDTVAVYYEMREVDDDNGGNGELGEGWFYVDDIAVHLTQMEEE
jgi:hypothetical protein